MKKLLSTVTLLAFIVLSTSAQCWRTQTIGGWGASPRGNNPGEYLHQNFDALLGTQGEVTIGSGSNIAVFTDAQAITDFLPASGTPVALDNYYVNPQNADLRNTFAAQVLALTISVGLDMAIPSFGESAVPLASLTVLEGTFEGYTVAILLSIANRALGGEDVGYSISELNQIISGINESFVDGNCDSNFLLTTPTPSPRFDP